MKILHIVPSYKPAYTYGGTTEAVATLCESLVQAGQQVTVYTTTANGKTELDVIAGKAYIINGVKVIYFKRQTKDPSHVSFALWKRMYADCRQFDAVHIHSWWNILVMVSALICKKKNIKTIFSPHGMLSNYILSKSNSKAKRLVHSSIGKSLLRYMLLHATTRAEFTECRQLIPGWKGFVLSNIILLPGIQISKKENSIFTILFLSRIHAKKGIELLMEAVSRLKVNVRLLIAGSGEEKYIDSLQQIAQRLNIRDKTEWPGWKNRNEKFETFMEADLFALTSYNENFAYAVVESLHAGTPVLLSGEVGLSGFVKENDLGWVCTLEPKDIANKIEAAIYDIEKRKRINHWASVIIQNHFSAEKLIPQYLQLYDG